MNNNRRRHNLRLSGVDVQVIGYGGTTVRRLHQRLLHHVIDNADVIFCHVGGNDYNDGRQPPMNTARDIVDLALYLVHVHGARGVIIGLLARFPAHMTDWSNDVNDCLRYLIPQVRRSYNIRLWEQRRGLYNHRSRLFGRDRVHVSPSSMHVYFNIVRYAIVSEIGRRF